MKIVYNPKHGAPITRYIFLGTLIDPHYPDGYEVEGKRYNGLMQYEDALAESITETFTFLDIIDADLAKKIIERPEDPEFKCEAPNCGFTTTYKVALAGHQRKHKAAGSEKSIYDESVIPVAGGKRVQSNPSVEYNDKFGPELKKGIDADGIEWYGEGATRDTNGFSAVPEVGRGHFVG